MCYATVAGLAKLQIKHILRVRIKRFIEHIMRVKFYYVEVILNLFWLYMTYKNCIEMHTYLYYFFYTCHTLSLYQNKDNIHM